MSMMMSPGPGVANAGVMTQSSDGEPTDDAMMDDEEEEEEEDDNNKLVPSSVGYERYRTEAVIQMGSPSNASAVRPRSFIETRSTPDVIVLR